MGSPDRVYCSFCGNATSCRSVRRHGHRLWCEACHDRYVVPSTLSQPAADADLPVPLGPDHVVVKSEGGTAPFTLPSPGRPGHKSWFLADLILCQAFLAGRSLAPVYDSSVRGLLVDPVLAFGHLPHVEAARGSVSV